MPPPRRWLGVLHAQSPGIASPSAGKMSRRRLPHAGEVVAWQLGVEQHARTTYTWELENHGTMLVKGAKAYQDAAMMAMMFGYLPPLRLACIRTCRHPDFCGFGAQCMEADCRRVGGRGTLVTQ